MVNSVFVDDKKMRDILTYISGMKHAKKIRMMFYVRTTVCGLSTSAICRLKMSIHPTGR